MRKLIILGLAIITFTACQQTEQRFFTESEEINVVKAEITAYQSGDFDKWKSYFADTAKMFFNSNKSVTVDVRYEESPEFTNNFKSYGFNREKEYLEMVINNKKETWVYYWATWNGELAVNNNKISFPAHMAFQFIDGKIVEEHLYFDATTMNAALKEIEAIKDSPEVVTEEDEPEVE
jgi:ketosteroid isomerase-like protein